MLDYANWAIANQAVMNPATTAAELTQIANAQPSLRAAVASHPAAHPALLDWLAHQGDPAVTAVVAARTQNAGQPSAPHFAPPSGFVPPMGFTSAPAPGFGQPAGFAPGYAPPRGTGGSGGMSRNMMLGLILGGVALIVAIALILVFTVLRPSSSTSDFNNAVNNYSQAQTALSAQLAKSQTVFDKADAKMMNDASLLTALQAALATAKDYRPVSVDKASGATASSLRLETSNVQSMTAKLISDTDAVQSDQKTWAKNTLSHAIAAASDIYAASQGSASDSALAGLKTAIDDAQAVLDGLNALDPADAGRKASDAKQALLAAEAAVVGGGSSTCQSNLPEGIDPMVCGGIPGDAVQIPWTSFAGGDLSTQMFLSADGDVGCMNFSDRVECDTSNATWQMPSQLMQTQICIESQNCGDAAIALLSDGSVTAWPRTDVPDYAEAKSENVSVPVVQYGQTVAFGRVACNVDVPGVTCWDISTHHGFQISSDGLLYW